MTYNIENLLADIKAILVSDLNANIAVVEAEKVGQGLPATNLSPVDTTNGYFEQNWSDAMLNINPAIFFGVEEIQAEGAGPVTKEYYKVFIEVVVVDRQTDTLMKNRIHRYAEAIRRTMQNNYDQIPSASKIKIETVRPISFKLDLNTSEEIRVGGVTIITALA